MNLTSPCITVTRQGLTLVARLRGGRLRRTDVAQRLAGELVQLLDDLPTPETVHLDLDHVPTLSSLVLNQLIIFNAQARGRGIQVLVIGLQPAVREVFQLTRLDRTFHMEGDAEPAAIPS